MPPKHEPLRKFLRKFKNEIKLSIISLLFSSFYSPSVLCPHVSLIYVVTSVHFLKSSSKCHLMMPFLILYVDLVICALGLLYHFNDSLKKMG